jgi:hypothetical protein
MSTHAPPYVYPNGRQPFSEYTAMASKSQACVKCPLAARKLKQLPQKCFCRRGLWLCSAPDLHDQSAGAQLCNQPFTLKCFRCPNIQIPSTPLRQLEGSRAQIILPLAARSDRHYPLIYASAQRNRLLTHLMFLPPATQTTRRTVLALLS